LQNSLLFEIVQDGVKNYLQVLAEEQEQEVIIEEQTLAEKQAEEQKQQVIIEEQARE